MADIIDFRVKNGLVVTTTATIEGSTQATSTSTGGLLVRSGAGVGGNLFVGGLTNIAGATTITNTTNASSTLTGALQVRGGAGIGQDVYIGGNLNVTGTITGTLAGNAPTVSVVRQPTNGTYYPAFVDSNNASATAESLYTTSSFFINPNTGLVTGDSFHATNNGNGTNFRVGDDIWIGDFNTANSLRLTGQQNTANAYIVFGTSDSTALGRAGTGPLTYGGSFAVTGATQATSTVTGAFTLTGGAGIGGNLYVGGTIFGTIGAAVTTATNIAGGGPGMVVYQSSTATTAFVATGTAGTVLVSNGSGSAPSFNNTLTLDSIVEATSTATGALQVRGGVGVNRDIWVGQRLNVGSDAIFTGDISVNGGDLLTNQTSFNLLNTTATTINFGGAGTNITVGASGSGATTVRHKFTVTDTTAATSTTTGALRVAGGAGIAGSLVVGGSSNIAGDETIGGDLSVNGGDLITNQTTFNLINTTATTLNIGGAGTNITIGATTGATTVRNATTVSNTTNATSTSAAALVVYGGVGINQDLRVGGTIFGTVGGTVTTATNIANGTAGQVPYQTGPSVTSFFGPGTAGNVLVSNGTSAPSYNNTLTLASTNQAGSTTTGALQVYGGLGIGGDFYQSGSHFLNGNIEIRGGTLSANSSTTFNLINTTATTINFGGAGTNITIGASASGATTVRNKFTVTDTTNATSTITGAVSVRGGASFGQDVFIGGAVDILATAASTSSITTNALYVAGGVGIGSSLYVQGKAYFQDDVIFSGTSTYVYSTQTLYTDNIVNLHVPAGSTGTSHTWAIDDGKDIGHIFHYYTGTDKDAFLGLATGSKFLEWWENGNESNGVYTGTTYGIFRTGGIRLTHTTASTTTATGALTVVGGVGVGGDMFIGGSVTVSGTINASVTGVITTATNIQGGTAGQVPYQTGAGLTSFFGPGTAGNVLVSNGTGAPTYNNTLTLAGTTAASSTQTGALQVRGGVGAGNIFVNNAKIISANTDGNTVGTIPLDIQGAWIRIGDATTGFAQSGGGIGIKLHDSGNTHWSVAMTNTNFVIAITSTDGDRLLPATRTDALLIDSAGHINGAGNINAAGDVAVNGGDVITNQTTFNLINTTATTINFGGAGTNITVGASGSGATTVRHKFTVTDTTNAVSTTTGALQSYGGLGIGGDFYQSGSHFLNGNIEIRGGTLSANSSTTFNLVNTTATTINFGGAGTNITIGATTGVTTIRNDTTVTSITAATSTATGALVVRGGVGINGAVVAGGAGNIGGDLTVGGDLSVNGGDIYTNQTTFNLVNTTATTINFGGAGTNITVGATTGATTIRNNTTVTSTTAASSTATGAFQVRGGVGIGGDLYVGGTINGTISGAGNANNILTTATSTASSYFLTFVDSNNSTAAYEALYTDAGIQFNPSSNDLLLAGDLQIQGGDLTTNQSTFNLLNSTATTINFGGASTVLNIGAAGAGYVQVKNNSAATSTATGALRVDGGLGVNGAIYGGNIFSNGSQVIPFKMEEFTASASQTTFTVTGGYVVGTVMVFVNGVFMNSGDFTASNGTTVVLTFARNAGDVVKIVSGGTSSSSNQQQSFSIAMSVALS